MNRFTGNSTELGGVVRESFVRSAWFPVAVNRIMECTPLHGSQQSQSDSVELVLPDTRTNERFANDSSSRTESRKLDHGNKSLNPPLVGTRFFQYWCNSRGFEGCRESSSGERGVDDGRDEGGQRREAGFN